MPNFKLANVSVGRNAPVRVMGVINLSPESFYKGSVSASTTALLKTIRTFERDGADFIDVGAMSTAPYLKTQISEALETERIIAALTLIKKHTALPISIDTMRARPALAALEAGADILNDVTGLRGDPLMPFVARQFNGVILMAHPSGIKNKITAQPIPTTLSLIKTSVQRARDAGIPATRIAVDPGIGFFRGMKTPWWKWDLAVLAGLKEIERLGYPVLAAVSRKSFIGKILGGVPPEERLAGSLAATKIAVLNGATIIRTHDVKATKQAIRDVQRRRG
jgi:dihydropteroate synthase